MTDTNSAKPSEARLSEARLSDPANLYSLPVPFSRKREQQLAGHSSTIIRLSLDDPGKWPNYIFENSRFAIFIWHHQEEKMLLLARGLGMPKKFRKQSCKSAAQFLDKINKYIASYEASLRTPK